MKKILLISLLFCSLNPNLSSQSLGRWMAQLDSLEKLEDTTGAIRDLEPAAYTKTTRINVQGYFILLLSDAKQQLSSPFHLSKRQWVNAGKMALLTGALAFADKPIQKEVLALRNMSSTVKKISKFITDFGGPYETYTLSELAAYGFLFKKEKVKNVTIMATEAYITAGAIESVMKFLTGRQRPSYYGSDSIEAQPTFHGPFARAGREYRGKTISSAFPSGHTTVAFAAATVFALEYRNRPLIPIVAYTAATLVGISRVTENKHWATDVLVGAALGYLSGRQVVNNYHRYAKLRAAKASSGSKVSFSVGYSNGQVLPGLVWRF